MRGARIYRGGAGFLEKRTAFSEAELALSPRVPGIGGGMWCCSLVKRDPAEMSAYYAEQGLKRTPQSLYCCCVPFSFPRRAARWCALIGPLPGTALYKPSFNSLPPRYQSWLLLLYLQLLTLLFCCSFLVWFQDEAGSLQVIEDSTFAYAARQVIPTSRLIELIKSSVELFETITRKWESSCDEGPSRKGSASFIIKG